MHQKCTRSASLTTEVLPPNQKCFHQTGSAPKLLPLNRKGTKSAFAKAKVYPKCFRRRGGAAVSWEVPLPYGRCHHHTGCAAVAQVVPSLHGKCHRFMECAAAATLPSTFHVAEGPSVNIPCKYRTVHQFREDFSSSNAVITAFLSTSSVSTRPSCNLWCGGGNFHQSPVWRWHFLSTSCAEAVLWCGDSAFRHFTGWQRHFRCIDWIF